MTELRIRVDAATKAMIEENARKKGISMSEYAGTILADYMSAPEHRALEDRYINAMKGIITSYQYLAQKLGEVVAENSTVLDRVMDRLNEGEGRSW